jgi:hypothetical protein
MVAKRDANGVEKHTKKERITKMSTKVSLHQAAEGHLGVIYENAIQEISTFLRAHPERILPLQHMMKVDNYFQLGVKKSADWLHTTAVNFSKVPKTLLRDVLLDYLKDQKGGQIWTDDVIRMIDKRHGHEGVLQMTEFLGSMSMSDQLEPRLHYKPLLRAVLLARFKEIGESVFYAQDMHIAFGNEKGIYQLSGKIGDVYNSITHVRLNVSVPIPDDFRVTDENWKFEDNHSWLRCILRGKKYNIQVYQVFVDCDQQRRIQYHRTSLLTALTDEMFPSHKTEYEASGGDREMCSSASTTIPPAAHNASVVSPIDGDGLAPGAVAAPRGSGVPSLGAVEGLLSQSGGA